jgi:exosortase
MDTINNPTPNLLANQKLPIYLWGLSVILLVLIFLESLDEMTSIWLGKEEYSHGFFIPAISIYLILVQRQSLNFVKDFKASILGLGILTVGLFLFILGGLATIRTIQHYAFIIAMTGIFAAAFGRSGLKTAWVPLVFLVFMVPFPNFILNNLSSKLQLISSWLGVEFIRACDIMVFLEGNVIDLGG